VDDAILSKDDASKNFFGDFNRVGEGRAAVVADNLAEMNPNVKIEAVKKVSVGVLRFTFNNSAVSTVSTRDYRKG
jgi:molybdopterin/thiamine biosynthesis adenylyltransferase